MTSIDMTAIQPLQLEAMTRVLTYLRSNFHTPGRSFALRPVIFGSFLNHALKGEKGKVMDVLCDYTGLTASPREWGHLHYPEVQRLTGDKNLVSQAQHLGKGTLMNGSNMLLLTGFYRPWDDAGFIIRYYRSNSRLKRVMDVAEIASLEEDQIAYDGAAMMATEAYKEAHRLPVEHERPNLRLVAGTAVSA